MRGFSSSWEFRSVCNDDLPEILEIERLSYTHPWTENNFIGCLRHHYHNWILFDPNAKTAAIVAYGFSNIILDEVQLLNLCVADRFRGQRAGEKMLRFMISQALIAGGKSMFLEVRKSNVAAIGLYSSVGFNEVGLRKGYYPAFSGREDAVVLALELALYEA